MGKYNSTDYKNMVSTVKVLAGQMNSPISDLNGETSWGSNSKTLALNYIVSSSSKLIRGTVLAKSTVLAFV